MSATDVEVVPSVTEEVVSTTEKFEMLMKDVMSHVDNAKSLGSRLKILQKEVSKLSKSGIKKVKTVKVVDPDAPKRVSALQKPVPISNELCSFLGFDLDTEHCRQEVTCTINKFIKDNNLQDPANRRFIQLDGSDAALKLKKLLREPEQPVTFFNIQRYLKPHYPPSEKEKKTLTVDTNVKPTTAEVPPPVKKSSTKKPVPDVKPDLDVVPDSGVDTEKKAPVKKVVKKKVATL